MDNTTILFNAIQRVYRNAIVELVRKRITDSFGEHGIGEIRKLFSNKISCPDGQMRTQWELVRTAAEERRTGGTGELATPIRDEFELLGVEYFFNVFEKHFIVLCPHHSERSKSQISQARQTLISWMKQIKNVRDPVSHPVTDDIDYEDSANVLYCARKILDFCNLPEAATHIVRLQSTLLGGLSNEMTKIHAVLPPSDEVVMDFVGRHKELAKLNEWFNRGTSRRWALSGEGGKGKSAIAYTFVRNVATRDDHGIQAVIWMSAKRRRFIEGQTILVDRPDFTDKSSAIKCIISAYGEEHSDDVDQNEASAINCLTLFPALLVVDDIDTVEAEGENAIQFLVMTIPEVTPSRVLLTSRRAMFGLANLTTQVEGLSPEDGEAFIKSRCDLMGLPMAAVLGAKQRILDVTDSSPLYIEDLLRLIQTGLELEAATGLWAEKRGTEARKYAMQREYDQLSEDAKHVLLALALQGPCRSEDICKGLNWSEDRLHDALQQLRNMFLMPRVGGATGKHELALNNNIRTLVLDVFGRSDAYSRVERNMRAATGELRTKRIEDFDVTQTLRRGGLLVQAGDSSTAKYEVEQAIAKYAGRSDLFAHLAWIEKKMGDVAAARIHFKRADQLRCRSKDAYWHWSDMEAFCGEWQASAEAAKKGIDKFGDDQGLLFRLGYALHRQGKELISDGELVRGQKLCKEASAVLERAKEKGDAESRNSSIKYQIYRAIVLNWEALEDGPSLARHFAKWQSECPYDPDLESEYVRIRQKYPEYLRAH